MNYSDYIEHYIAEKKSIFPCMLVNTIPIEQGALDNLSSSNADYNRRRFSDIDKPNIGLVTGRKNNLIVVETDYDGDSNKVLEMFESFKNNPAYFDTRTVITPFGKIQRYFKYPRGVKYIESKTNAKDGTNIYADGSYVIAPGSRFNDNIYTYYDINTSVIAAPGWLSNTIHLTKLSSHNLDYYFQQWLINDCKKMTTSLLIGSSTILAIELYESYKAWSKRGSPNSGHLHKELFFRKMEDCGYTKKRVSSIEADDIYIGIEPNHPLRLEGGTYV